MSKKKPKPKSDEPAVFSGMHEEPAALPKRHKAEPATVDPWQRVADECPVQLSAEWHKTHGDRHHVQAYLQPILCLPVVIGMPHPVAIESKPPWQNIPIAVPYRVSDAYGRAAWGHRWS